MKGQSLSASCLDGSLNLLDLVNSALHASVIRLVATASLKLKSVAALTLTLQPTLPTKLDRGAAVTSRNAVSKEGASSVNGLLDSDDAAKVLLDARKIAALALFALLVKSTALKKGKK